MEGSCGVRSQPMCDYIIFSRLGDCSKLFINWKLSSRIFANTKKHYILQGELTEVSVDKITGPVS